MKHDAIGKALDANVEAALEQSHESLGVRPAEIAAGPQQPDGSIADDELLRAIGLNSATAVSSEVSKVR